MGKDGFREFVKKNPNLVDYVINNKRVELTFEKQGKFFR